PADRAGIRSQRLDPLLGATQACRGDHLHRTRDLLDVLDRTDPIADVALRSGHESLDRKACLRRLGLLLVLVVLLLFLGAVTLPLAARPILFIVVERMTLFVEVEPEVLRELPDRLLDLRLGVVAPVTA